MSKIYYENQYKKQINTDIISITKKDNNYLVELRDDIFFPGGGGQSRDFGTIDGIEILDILEENGKQIYVLNKEIEKQKNVLCEIDWNNRLDYMQQHLAQHVLSGCFFSIFNANTAGIHLGKEISYVDIIGDISLDKIQLAEKKANEIIHENRKVNFIETDREEALNMGLRRKLQTDDNTIRVVQIENLDINACCGVHPSNTLELQMIKIINHEKHKGNTRIFYLAGNRAVNYAVNNLNIFNNICIELSTGAKDINATIDNLKSDNTRLKDENSKLELKLSAYEIDNLINNAECIGDYKIITNIFEKYNQKYLTRMVNKIIEQDNFIALFVNKTNKKYSLIFARSKNITDIDMGKLLKELLETAKGKGGGSKFLAQGVIETTNIERIQETLKNIKKSCESALKQ